MEFNYHKQKNTLQDKTFIYSQEMIISMPKVNEKIQGIVVDEPSEQKEIQTRKNIKVDGNNVKMLSLMVISIINLISLVKNV